MNYNDYDIQTLEHKVRKYSQKLAEAKASMSGGADKKVEKKDTKKVDKKDTKRTDKKDNKREPRPEAKNLLRVECVEVDQQREDLKYSSRTCKTPPMNIRLSEDENKLSYIVKIILQYVNRRLRTKEVKEVHYTIGKKTTKVAGDKLGETMYNVVTNPEIKEIKIIM